MIRILGVSLVIVGLTVLLHLAALRRLSRFLRRLEDRVLAATLALIFSLLLVHLIEICLFATGYALITRMATVGELSGLTGAWTDYAYFSGTVYTTVGFGDIVPRGPIRLLSALEALTGLLMVAWSASFTFLEMQRLWRRGPMQET